MQKILVTSILFFSLFASMVAADIDPIAQTKLLLDQYSARVKVLEVENIILREEMRKAGIKIPLSTYSGAILGVASSTTTVLTGTSTVTPTPPALTISGEVSYGYTEKTYGANYTGFIKRIISEWDKVRDAYVLPKNAHIGGYEFVTTGALDHVFVDINYTGSLSASGIYDTKILYQFDKTTFARKLIGFFEYNATTGYYVTKTGKNIFPGVSRTWVPDPRVFNATSPVTSSPNSSVVTTTSPTGSTVSYADIERAYSAKRFLSVITLSNVWLASNTANLDVLRLRYRTYFIIAKYSEALKEIEKIRSLGQLSSAVACEANVIATFSKDTTLADSYKVICNKK